MKYCQKSWMSSTSVSPKCSEWACGQLAEYIADTPGQYTVVCAKHIGSYSVVRVIAWRPKPAAFCGYCRRQSEYIMASQGFVKGCCRRHRQLALLYFLGREYNIRRVYPRSLQIYTRVQYLKTPTRPPTITKGRNNIGGDYKSRGPRRRGMS